MLIDGVMLLWFILTAASVLFVAIDIRTTPEHPVMKWAFVLFTAYSGPIGAFLYVLGCREPLPGLHERYVAALTRQFQRIANAHFFLAQVEAVHAGAGEIRNQIEIEPVTDPVGCVS